jgi:2-polyprenyl-3-methyl-5-hydroxy-6-metoxy-1,4-benzoquinol methylase
VAPCVICKLGSPKYWGRARGFPHSLTRCSECGHIAVSAEHRNAELNLAIQLEAFDGAFAARSGAFVSLYDNINSHRTVRALHLHPHSRVLEVGPGNGSVMVDLAALGHAVAGLDLSPAVASAIHDRFGLPVIVRTMAQHIVEGGAARYDAVVIRHTLEHIYDPVAALQDSFKLLKPAGKLYVAVPNMDSWHRHFSGWTGYDLSHMHFFGKRSLSMAMQRAGFHVICAGSYESLAGWSNSLFRSVPGLGRRIGVAFPPAGSLSPNRQVVRKLARNILEFGRCGLGVALSPLRWTQSLLGRGEELFMIAEKPQG